jgi:hypothetical protein
MVSGLAARCVKYTCLSLFFGWNAVVSGWGVSVMGNDEMYPYVSFGIN